jgi:hypothetical protein
MRRFAVMAAALLTLPACDSGGGTEPTDYIAEDYIGEWELTVAAAPNCWPEFSIFFDVDISHVDPFRGESSFSFDDPTGWWRQATPATRNRLTMAVNGANRSFVIRAGNGDLLATFAGDGLNRNFLNGFFSDPDNVFRTLSGTHPCEAPAIARRSD